ncbi:Uma2 family endonuclease [Actinocorallia cavernae]|uniref:Uma2 family endonuclease n=2 Tax=Actinomycetes TaxID=1760 RepID=A0ABP5Y2Z5_9ACTN
MRDRIIVEYFQELRPPEGARAELLRGTIVIAPSSGAIHDGNVSAVVNQLPRTCWSGITSQGVDMLEGSSVPVPDVVVAERAARVERGALMPSQAVTALVEVVCARSVYRDYLIKGSIYAAAKVPAYLIIDPVMAQCVLFTEPTGHGENADYRCRRITAFGDSTPLEPVGIELDTSEFAVYENIRPHRYP